MSDDWNRVREWRKLKRQELIAMRRKLSRREKMRYASSIVTLLETSMSWFTGRRIGFYWPMKGEIDLVPFLRRLLPSIEDAALPVIVEKARPIEFWQWSARTKLCTRGIWNIPSPAERIVVQPDVLLIPLVGFDEAGYRLGYGGGYYDRTLAELNPRPFSIGVGYQMSRLDSIEPQPHDIPLDVIVTEEQVRWPARG